MSLTESTVRSLWMSTGGVLGWENISGYLMLERGTDSASVHLSWCPESYTHAEFAVCRYAEKYHPSSNDYYEQESMGGKKKGVLTTMCSSLVFCSFLYSHVQVPFCSLFLFLFCTRAAGRLDVQFWTWCCHSALLRWENAVGLLKGYSGFINT